MKKIIFTRTIDIYHKNILQTAGFDVLDYDFLKITPLPSSQQIILEELPNIKNLVFTSQHAVKIFFQTYPSNLFDGINIFSTSGETKNLLENYHLSPTLSAPTAKQLAKIMLEKADLSEGIHFICGNIGLNHLPDILTENRISVKKLVVYETKKTPLSISEEFDAVAFLSLSAADAFLEKNTLSPKMHVFTLGETTANHVRKKTKAQHIFVAEKPTISTLIDLILKSNPNSINSN